MFYPTTRVGQIHLQKRPRSVASSTLLWPVNRRIMQYFSSYRHATNNVTTGEATNFSYSRTLLGWKHIGVA